MMDYNLLPLILTFKLAFITTAILIVLGIPLAYWLAFTKRTWRHLIEPLVSMPLVLPPTVLGFYILLLFSPQYAVGNFFTSILKVQVVFSFLGLVVGSVVFSLPFMVNPLKAGFQNFTHTLIE